MREKSLVKGNMSKGRQDEWFADRQPSAHWDADGETRIFRSTSVLLVDDDRPAADEVGRHFERNGFEVFVAHSLAEARSLLQQAQARLDAVVTELLLPDGSSEALLADIEACARQPAAIIATTRLTDLKPASLEYRPIVLMKPISPARLLQVVRTVARGYARPVIRRFVERFGLSRREAEAVVCVAQGLRPKELAERMRCSEPTAYCHLTHACKKTGSSHYQELVAKLLAFACHTAGHTPPDHRAFVDQPPILKPVENVAKGRVGENRVRGVSG